MEKPDALVLFSGGLDSILTADILKEQGCSVLCLHMTSPFFGNAAEIPRWERIYGLKIAHIDIGPAFIEMLRTGPRFGFGKTLNPCVDCKILLLRAANTYRTSIGARILATGEVLGQRPMSQRRDVLATIAREAGVHDCLVRPLSALRMKESPVEQAGLLNRTQLLGISGRGRQVQLRLAEHFHLPEIPAPAGGCRLTERENVRRYWTILKHVQTAGVEDFAIANVGRQFWHIGEDAAYWLAVGRNEVDNEQLERLVGPNDALISFPHISAPLALARAGAHWPEERLLSAGSLALSYAVRALTTSPYHVLRLQICGQQREYTVTAKRNSDWTLPSWEDVHEDLVALRKGHDINQALV